MSNLFNFRIQPSYFCNEVSIQMRLLHSIGYYYCFLEIAH